MPLFQTTPCKPSNTQFSPISGPLPAEICLNKLLVHLVSINDNLQNATEDHCSTPSEPSSPSTTTSTQSPHSSSLRISISESESESTSSQSELSTASNRQLCPDLPPRYSETFLMRIQGRPQVRVMLLYKVLLVQMQIIGNQYCC